MDNDVIWVNAFVDGIKYKKVNRTEVIKSCIYSPDQSVMP